MGSKTMFKYYRQRKALEKSIEAWQHKKEKLSYEIIPLMDRQSCPCCVIYTCCKGCPIAEYTSALDCRNTPYVAADTVLKKYIKEECEIEDVFFQFNEEIKFLKRVKREIRALVECPIKNN
jgi:hypothetical protein